RTRNTRLHRGIGEKQNGVVERLHRSGKRATEHHGSARFGVSDEICFPVGCFRLGECRTCGASEWCEFVVAQQSIRKRVDVGHRSACQRDQREAIARGERIARILHGGAGRASVAEFDRPSGERTSRKRTMRAPSSEIQYCGGLLSRRLPRRSERGKKPCGS